jgi:hypothetical protein
MAAQIMVFRPSFVELHNLHHAGLVGLTWVKSSEGQLMIDNINLRVVRS